MSRTTAEAGCASSTIENESVVPPSPTLEPGPVSVIVKPAPSSSVVVETTVAERPVYPSSDNPSMTAISIVVVTSPSRIGSSTPVTVTTWGFSQLAFVKVTVSGATATSPASVLATLSNTSVSGSESSTMLNWSMVPVSETVVAPPDSATEIPGMSLSVV